VQLLHVVVVVPKWFRRFGDIPALVYEPPRHLDRRKLAGHDAVPEQQVHEFDGKRRETLWWPGQAGGGGSSASPAHERAFGDRSDVSTATVLRHVYEGLELPGEPTDYHFLIQGCAEQLWSRRRDEPNVVAEVERLCWLDIKLVQLCPDAASDEYSEHFYAIFAFLRLVEIYEREGFLAEALQVADIAADYGQCEQARQRLVERIAAVDAETDAQ
jgi:hypothetical protein